MKNKNVIPRNMARIVARCKVDFGDFSKAGDVLHVYHNDYGYIALNTRTGLYGYLFKSYLNNVDLFDFLSVERNDENSFIFIAEKGDYKTAYADYLKFESGFDVTARNYIDFETFVTELKKGYGNSDYIQIARLKETDDGIFYDNDYV